MTGNLDRALKSNEWRIVFDASFTSAKNLRKQKRDAHFKRKVDKKNAQPQAKPAEE